MRHLSRLTLALAVVFGAAACTDDSLAGVDTVQAEAPSSAATGPAGEALYRVTFENLTGGQPLTPPVAAVHRQSAELFEAGEAASFEVKEIAENGNLAPMQALIGGSPQVVDFATVPGAGGPVMPGETIVFELEGRTGAKYLSMIAMLVCTNDGFTGTNSLRLPKRIGESTTLDAYGYDAGTEINTEAWDDLVPPCAGLTGFDSMGAGTGASDPSLAEGGVVRMHPGIAGSADLDAAVHGWTGAASRITVERIG